MKMPDYYQRKRLPYGFIFLDVAETKRLKSHALIAEKILEENQYQPVMPAVIDFRETFEIFGREDLFYLNDHLGDHLALRNDVTVQIIKGFCNQLDRKYIQSEVSRYYYNVPVFTDVKKNYPSLREVQQLGAEIIGAKSEEAVFEIIQISNKIFKEIFSIPYTLICGDIRLFNFLKSYFSYNELDDIIMKKNCDHLILLMIEKGWKKEIASLFSRNLLYCKEEKILNEAMRFIESKLTGNRQKFICQIREILKPLFRLKNKLITEGILVDIEPLLVRSPKYYTGLLFEGYISSLSSPPLRGGSYDKLISEYSNQNYPASGFALDMSSILR